MDLFIDLVDESSLHINYISTKANKYKTAVINGWADQPFVDRDGNGKFIKLFQTEFNSPLWELYCYQVLKSLGCVFDFTLPFPDFVAEYNGYPFLVECVIANNADGTPEESDYKAKLNDDSTIDEKVNSQIVRLASALAKKRTKLINTYLKKPDNNGKPYVVAVEPFDQPYFMDTGVEAIQALLYGWIIERKTGRIFPRDNIIKSNGSDIPIGIFTNDGYKGVSGVLFSNTANIGKVNAISNNPRLTFVHSRYSSFDKPELSVDSRIKYDRFDSHCNRIRETFSKKAKFYKHWSPRKPNFIEWNVNYTETLTDGLNYFINPYAENPLSEELLDVMYNSGINIFNYDIESNSLVDNRLHLGSLIARNVYI